jgi:hypothetical protein
MKQHDTADFILFGNGSESVEMGSEFHPGRFVLEVIYVELSGTRARRRRNYLSQTRVTLFDANIAAYRLPEFCSG